MTPAKKEFAAIVLLLKQPCLVDPKTAERAAAAAFRGAPEPPKVVQIPNKPAIGVLVGPLRLGIVSVDRPYFQDVAKAADRVSNVPARMAIQQHAAWLSVDVIGEPPPIEPPKLYGLIGCLIAEFLGDDVLGLIRIPGGPVIGYDFSFIPMFRNRRAAEAFDRGTPDRIVKASASSAELIAAAEEARRRWPEFVSAFANRYTGQGFGAKKKFVDGKDVEHMWINVTNIEGSTIHGWLSNEPRIIKSLKMNDPIVMSASEVEDWIYTNGKTNVGGFQARVLRKDHR